MQRQGTALGAAADAAAVANIRGLGLIGLLGAGDHHATPHMALARGDAMPDHGRYIGHCKAVGCPGHNERRRYGVLSSVYRRSVRRASPS